MFEWDDLKYFLAVARHGSTVAAAKALSLSQSTVHRRLKELERRLGCRLVLRNPAGYKLTELGEQLVGHAARVEEAALAFQRAATGSQAGLSGLLTITCPEPLGTRLMRSNLIESFGIRFPELRIKFVMSDKLLDLGRGEADLAIRGMEPKDEALISRRITNVPWAIYASAPYCARRGKPESLGDIDTHDIVLFDVELGEHVTNQWFRRLAPEAHVAARCNSISGLVATAKSGIGLAALPVAVGDPESDLVRLLGPVPEITTHFYLVFHRDLRDSPRVKAFSTFVDDNMRTIRAVLGGRSTAQLTG